LRVRGVDQRRDRAGCRFGCDDGRELAVRPGICVGGWLEGVQPVRSVTGMVVCRIRQAGGEVLELSYFGLDDGGGLTPVARQLTGERLAVGDRVVAWASVRLQAPQERGGKTYGARIRWNLLAMWRDDEPEEEDVEGVEADISEVPGFAMSASPASDKAGGGGRVQAKPLALAKGDS
jgi:hypothetical protein